MQSEEDRRILQGPSTQDEKEEGIPQVRPDYADNRSEETLVNFGIDGDSSVGQPDESKKESICVENPQRLYAGHP